MFLDESTIDIQNKLAYYCRTGEHILIEGVQEERLPHYRRLIFNNINNALSQAFPLTKEWFKEEGWLMLVNSFFENHDAQTPKIWEMPKEFMEYVVNNDYAKKINRPSLNDLLLLEWIEIAVHTMEDIEVPFYMDIGDNMNDTLVLNPEYSLQKLEYPVHLLHADEAAMKKGDWFVYVFRNQESGVVQFLNISVLHTYVLEKIYEKPQSINDLLPYILSIFGLTDGDQIKKALCLFVSDLYSKGAVLGYKHDK